MNDKTIILDKNYLPNIDGVENERNETMKIINDIYSRFNNEYNYNMKCYAEDALEGYRYAHKRYNIPEGLYIRYIDTRNPNELSLKTGGFVIDDNGWSIQLKNDRGLFKIRKNKCNIFICVH